MSGKKKISIEEAFSALRNAGINVKIDDVSKPVDETPDFVVAKPGAKPKKQKESKGKPGISKVTLSTQHCIGSGGVEDEDGVITHAGVVTYGPGVCEVPSELAGALLHQDQLAKQQDERMLDRTQRSYMVVPRRSGSQRNNVAVRVDDSILNNGIDLSRLGDGDMIRG